ncbi:MAG: hypothetical protein B6243_08870 [Anaerolineaceae bacterium 4572_5.2]|nr:MAG: hypothetical protein B6243_08870 [Anaerolineaceae bacterium 4572_5.2]
MQIGLKLHSILRDYLPPETKGTTILALPNGATAAHLLAHLKIDRQCSILVNGQEVEDENHLLQDGDEVQMLIILGGGS